MNSMPKYVVSRRLQEPLAWNAAFMMGELAESVPDLKDRHGPLIAVGAGGLPMPSPLRAWSTSSGSG
jgi:hypothetical protein